MAQHTINLLCIADTWVEALNNTNFGTSTTLKFGWYSSPSSVTLLKFDHSLIPSGKKLVSAALKIYNLIARTPESYCRIKYAIRVADWQENVINWSNGSISTSYQKSKTFTSLSANQYIDVDITDLNTIVSLMGSINGIQLDCENVSSVTSNNYILIASRETANPPILQIIYEDVPPDKPTLNSPIGLNIDNTSVIRFNWTYNSTVGGVQKKFDFLWSTNSVSWDIISQTTANNYYDMPANTVPSGNIYWKVKTYNDYNEASVDSDVGAFFAVGVPQSPSIINISNDTARPLLTWTATGQQIYQVQVLQGDDLIYESDSIASMTEHSHKVQLFLQDGTYVARVRIKNEYDLWSAWAGTNFTISTTKPSKPPLVVNVNKLTVTAESDIPSSGYLLLYRAVGDSSAFVCISKSDGNILIDTSTESNKQYKYFVRSVSSEETFADSDILTVQSPVLINPTLLPVSMPGEEPFEIMYNLKEGPIKNTVLSLDHKTSYYSGRKYPVTEYSEHVSLGVSVSFFLKTDDDYLKLVQIVGLKDVILYRDSRRKLYGNIHDLNTTDHWNGYLVSFTINQVDYSEEIEV